MLRKHARHHETGEPLPDARAFAARWTAKFGVRVSFVDAQTGSPCGW